MSWQDYVNENITKLNQEIKSKPYHTDKYAVILENSDGSLWTSNSSEISLKKDTIDVINDDGTTSKVEVNEFSNLIDTFNNSGVSSSPVGIRINGEKFLPVNFESSKQMLYLKKTSGGAAVVKTKTGFVIRVFSSNRNGYNGQDDTHEPFTSKSLEEIHKYLVENNL
jgi:hypothetical protein